jgi:hydroxymethylpyrimidine pyrophosphatase-like HAD family hydrolase
VSTRVVYTDLDGTMVGPRGSFWHTATRDLTTDPAAALHDLHRAGVALVLVSGRTFEQVVEAARIFAADGAIAELGAVVSWNGGRGVHRLTGVLPDEYAGRAPMEVMAELGVVEDLLARHPGRLEWHAPWHTTHLTDALLRGRVDPLAVDAELAERGTGWLTLKDNGAIPVTSRMTLAPEGRPPRVYHLMPRGISKGAAIAWDLERRGLTPADAVAIGDSVSDLEMAPAVDRLWITANGATVDGMADLLAAVPNVTVTDRLRR